MSCLREHFVSSKTLSAARITFFISGIGMGAWAPLVPFARDRASLDEASLGMLLFCLGAGSMLMMPFVGRVAGRIGCRNTMLLACVGIAISLVGLSMAGSFWLLVAFLLLFGASVGTADVNMNLQGSVVERHLGKSLMSGFHGLFSVGNIFSAVVLSGLLWCGLSPTAAIGVLIVLCATMLAYFAKHMLPYAESERAEGKSKVSGLAILLGGLCFVAFLVEGSMLDWSAVFLKSFRDVPASNAAIGYAAFSTMMAVGRLTGDRVVGWLGAKRVLVLGALLAIAGMTLAVAVNDALVSVLGFVMVGAGLSNLVPIFCSRAGRQTDMPVGQALATVNAIGYAGILMGPALIGFVAHLTSLSIALVITGLLLLSVLITSKTVSYEITDQR
ncbi:Uncharacterized protein ALO63_00139 [Pseudomonas amygdali pv. mori]|uniref:Major facilitator superfamily (MFS) profile domain-containing protein n=1 Tax=Pseudomonas amygdali pv. mori TaxID=34065 RepID=A0A0P9UUS4_PSEA0|nr:Uncharacterized protein ALO63_00139 [Pseudomonas amygdali pv. mori]